MHLKLIPTLAVIAAFGLCPGCGPRSSDVAVKVATLRQRFGDVYSSGLAFSPDDSRIAIESDGENINIWDWRKDMIVKTVQKPQGAAGTVANPLAYSPDGSLLAACDTSGVGNVIVRVWNTSDWSIAHDIADGSSCNGVAFTPDGKSMVRTDDSYRVNDDGVLVYSVSSWQKIWGTKFENFHPGAVSISPDGRYAAVEGPVTIVPKGIPDAAEMFRLTKRENHTNILDLQERKAVRVLQGDAEGPLAWSPDSGRIAIVGHLYIEMFDTHSGQRLVHEKEAPSSQLNARFSPDGRYFIESDLDGRGNGLGGEDLGCPSPASSATYFLWGHRQHRRIARRPISGGWVHGTYDSLGIEISVAEYGCSRSLENCLLLHGRHEADPHPCRIRSQLRQSHSGLAAAQADKNQGGRGVTRRLRETAARCWRRSYTLKTRGMEKWCS